MNTTAKFYGIGVGPGDPELMTLKSINYIKDSTCIILPAKDKESCHAYQIAAEVVPEIDRKELLFCPFPMTMKRDELVEFHNQVAEMVMDKLNVGKSVAFLTIGDPTLYSTYSYIREIVVNAGYEIDIVSGINSFSAVAARLGISLGDGSEQIHIIPGSANLDSTMELSGTRIYMKSGKKLAELIERLRIQMDTKPLKIYSVSNCGMDSETVAYAIDEINTESGYLTIVIVKEA